MNLHELVFPGIIYLHSIQAAWWSGLLITEICIEYLLKYVFIDSNEYYIKKLTDLQSLLVISSTSQYSSYEH